MSNTAVRRMYTDIKQFQAANLEADGIFCSFNEDDLFDVKAMVVGPKDTPYEDGFYFFRLTFPKNYPFAPPKAVFETRYNTTNAKLRFNPNLYANGKVCVSLLGTWSGPQWEPCQSLYSILLAFQTLLVEEPLTNEPGYSKVTPSQRHKHTKYTEMVAFENYRVAILQMLESPPQGFEAFIPIMQQWTHRHSTAITLRLAKAVEAHPDSTLYHCSVYNRFSTMVDYPRIHTEFVQMTAQLAPLFTVAEGTVATGDMATGISTNSGGRSTDHAKDTGSATLQETVTASATPTASPEAALLSSPSVETEVETAVAAFAKTTLSPPSAPTKAKRKRPSDKAKEQPYQLVKVPQPEGEPCTYQAVPSEYTVKRGDLPPTKRTRWLWRRVTARTPVLSPPGAPSTSPEAIVL